MNDINKLKQLAEQAGFLTFAGPDIHVPEDPYGDGCSAVLAKFAELIVRECNRVIHDGTNPSIFYQQRILRHFGVEE